MRRSLTKASAVGVAWLLAQTGGMRIVTFLAQILLARLLRPTDFGDVALANSVAAVIAVLVGFGIDDVILSRSRRFRMWIAPAFWIGFALSILGALILLAAAPIAARVYRSSNMLGLLLVLAVSLPLSALSAVPTASLRSDMRFSFLAAYGLTELVGIQLITILLAWRGFGAYSFVIPVPIAAAAKAAIFWRIKPLHDNWRFRRSQFRVLLNSGAAVFGQKLLLSLRNNGDYMLLGIVASHTVVGLYFMAFKLAAMPVYAFANSLTNVLYPALANLRGEPARQKAAALSASKIIALVVIPLSFLQAAVSDSVVHFFFGDKWMGASPMLSILSVGLAFDVVPCVAGALLSANGKFKAQWNWVLVSVPFFFLLIGLGAFVHGAEGVAVAVAAFFILQAPIYSYLAMHPSGCSLRDIAGIYLPPTICATAAISLGVGMSKLPHVQDRDLAIIAVVCAFSLAAYALFVRFLAPEAARDTLQKFFMLCGRPA